MNITRHMLTALRAEPENVCSCHSYSDLESYKFQLNHHGDIKHIRMGDLRFVISSHKGSQ